MFLVTYSSELVSRLTPMHAKIQWRSQIDVIKLFRVPQPLVFSDSLVGRTDGFPALCIHGEKRQEEPSLILDPNSTWLHWSQWLISCFIPGARLGNERVQRRPRLLSFKFPACLACMLLCICLTLGGRGKSPILVATDLASRGLDVKDIKCASGWVFVLNQTNNVKHMVTCLRQDVFYVQVCHQLRLSKPDWGLCNVFVWESSWSSHSMLLTAWHKLLFYLRYS